MEKSYDTMMAAKSFLPFRMGYLTDWMVNQAEDELNETKENRAQGLKELRRLIASEKNLDVWTDDSYLLQFLRARKFDPERAMELIRNLYSLFKKYPEVFPKNLDTAPARSLLDTNAAGPFSYRHKDGSAVLFVKVSAWNPEKHSAELVYTALIAILLSIAEDPATQVCGVHVIYDASFELKHLRFITPRFIKLYSSILRNRIPVKFNSIHIVNASPIFGYLFTIFKIFLSEKIKKRFHFHGRDMKELHEYIPKEILSSQFGGDNINYSASKICEEEVLPFIERFCELLRKGYSS